MQIQSGKSISRLLTAAFIAAIAITGCTAPEETADIPVFCDNFQAHVETLASDEMEGRAPSTPGGQRAKEYIIGEFSRIGLEPGNNGSYLQAVPLVEITGYDFSDLRISGHGQQMSLAYLDDMVIGTNRLQDRSEISESEMIFAGYGIVAPEYGWNDYEGLDVEGKTVVVLVNDPGFVTGDDEMFGGRAMTYYGRWTYKFEEAARQGAAAALIIHQTEPASYGWDVVRNSWSGTQYGIGEDTDEPQLEAEGWIQKEVARQIFEVAGLDLDQMLDRAAMPGFEPVELGLFASADFRNEFQYSECHNVVGYIEGTDYPEETILYMGHWDHLGMVETDDGVEIYNGAVDNATGVGAIISIAERFMSEGRPGRSVVFMAVTAEESGLLGSSYYADNPLFPLETTVGGINIDALNVYGPTWDVSVVGYGNSELEEYLSEYAAQQDRYLTPEPTPEAGYFYRSDHISLARQGVPMIYAQGGVDYIGQDQEYAQMVAEDMASRYHAPTDIIHDKWVWDGMHQDMWLYFNIGFELANSDDFPNWYEGNEFREIRDRSSEMRSR